MPFAFLLSLLPAWFAGFAGVQSDQVRTLVVQEEVIMRVPVRPMPHRFDWEEHKGPKCIDAATIGGAAITASDSVDFILKGGKRVRAILEDQCPALDYYSGFYFRAPADGKLCADRDSIRTRSGGDCQIDKFRTLTPIDSSK